MPNRHQLFDQFPIHSNSEWIEKIKKETKGKSPETFDWLLEEHIKIHALYSKEDTIEAASPITTNRNNNRWKIGEYIHVDNIKAANTHILEGLSGGVNAPLFNFKHQPTIDELSVLLAGVHPDFISIHFAPQYPGKDPALLFRDLIYYTRRRNLTLSDISGSMDFDPLLDWTKPPFKPLTRILRFAHQYTPLFRVLQVNGRILHSGVENSAHELALIIAKGHEYIVQMQEFGISPSITNNHMQFSIAISKSYFLEIAKIRALKILWSNILNAHGLSSEVLPHIIVHQARESITTDSEKNMIQAATQMMSAAIGGADIIYNHVADEKSNIEGSSQSRRIARNVQHLLQMESNIDNVIDPAAGSYYIENITQQLCEKAWKLFKDIEAQGGYMNIERLP